MKNLLLKDLWKYWAECSNIPEEALDSWIADPNRIYHCIFCSRHWKKDAPRLLFKVSEHVTTSAIACPACHEYKGIEPCIPNYCECYHLNVVRKLSKGGNK